MKDYRFERPIGEGSFGKVYLATHLPTGGEAAVKKIRKSHLDNHLALKRLKKEIQILKQLKSPHIIELYEVVEDRDNIYLIMEYAPSGDLIDYI